MSDTEDYQLDKEKDLIVLRLLADLRFRKLQGSNNIATATLAMLEKVMDEMENATTLELCKVLRAVGRRIDNAAPHELVATNMVRRVLRIIRDEERAHDNENVEGGESLQRLVLAGERTEGREGTPGGEGGSAGGEAGAAGGEEAAAAPAPLAALREPLAEMAVELESSVSTISAHAVEQLKPGEMVLTYGASSYVESTLMAAARGLAGGRPPRAMVAGGPTPRKTHEMAVRLSDAGIYVTVIDLSCCFAVMPKVDKVLIGVRAVLAGNNFMATAGMYMVTLAANYFKKPVIALAPLYKVSPVYACDEMDFNVMQSPEAALPYANPLSATVHAYSPMYEQVPADQVAMFITNHGPCAPTYIYRLLQELYDRRDYEL